MAEPWLPQAFPPSAPSSLSPPARVRACPWPHRHSQQTLAACETTPSLAQHQAHLTPIPPLHRICLQKKPPPTHPAQAPYQPSTWTSSAPSPTRSPRRSRPSPPAVNNGSRSRPAASARRPSCHTTTSSSRCASTPSRPPIRSCSLRLPSTPTRLTTTRLTSRRASRTWARALATRYTLDNLGSTTACNPR